MIPMEWKTLINKDDVVFVLNDLIDNQDIEITTKEEYVVGYLCKMIAERK